MQIDDLLSPEKPSKINNQYWQKGTEWKICVDTMEYLIMPRPEPSVTFKKHMIDRLLGCFTSCIKCVPLHSFCL